MNTIQKKLFMLCVIAICSNTQTVFADISSPISSAQLKAIAAQSASQVLANYVAASSATPQTSDTTAAAAAPSSPTVANVSSQILSQILAARLQQGQTTDAASAAAQEASQAAASALITSGTQLVADKTPQLIAAGATTLSNTKKALTEGAAGQNVRYVRDRTVDTVKQKASAVKEKASNLFTLDTDEDETETAYAKARKAISAQSAKVRYFLPDLKNTTAAKNSPTMTKAHAEAKIAQENALYQIINALAASRKLTVAQQEALGKLNQQELQALLTKSAQQYNSNYAERKAKEFPASSTADADDLKDFAQKYHTRMALLTKNLNDALEAADKYTVILSSAVPVTFTVKNTDTQTESETENSKYLDSLGDGNYFGAETEDDLNMVKEKAATKPESLTIKDLEIFKAFSQAIRNKNLNPQQKAVLAKLYRSLEAHDQYLTTILGAGRSWYQKLSDQDQATIKKAKEDPTSLDAADFAQLAKLTLKERHQEFSVEQLKAIVDQYHLLLQSKIAAGAKSLTSAEIAVLSAADVRDMSAQYEGLSPNQKYELTLQAIYLAAHYKAPKLSKKAKAKVIPAETEKLTAAADVKANSPSKLTISDIEYLSLTGMKNLYNAIIAMGKSTDTDFGNKAANAIYTAGRLLVAKALGTAGIFATDEIKQALIAKALSLMTPQ